MNGSEIQTSSLRKLHDLRSSVVSVLFKKNRIRSLFLALATFYDVFVDLFGKWAFHCFNIFLKVSKFHLQLISDVLCKTKTLQVIIKSSHNKVTAVFAYLYNEFEFIISNASSFIFECNIYISKYLYTYIHIYVYTNIHIQLILNAHILRCGTYTLYIYIFTHIYIHICANCSVYTSTHI